MSQGNAAGDGATPHADRMTSPLSLLDVRDCLWFTCCVSIPIRSGHFDMEGV